MAEPAASGPDERHLRRLVSTLRAHGGAAAVGPACHEAVPEVDGVVLSVFAAYAGPVVFSDSGLAGDDLEDVYGGVAEGPAVQAAATAAVVTAADVQDASAVQRWPRFAQRASAAGVNAVFAYPVLVGGVPVGVLSLYRASAGPLSDPAEKQAQVFSRAAAVVLQGMPDDGTAVVLPEYAREIQQAVGVVMEMAGIDAPTALHRLRVYARDSTRPMREIVAEVRTCRLPFDPTIPV